MQFIWWTETEASKRHRGVAIFSHATGIYPVCSSVTHDTVRRILRTLLLQAQRSEESPAEPRRRFRERCYLLIVTEASEVPTAIANAGIIAISGPRHREAQCMSREL